MNLWTTRSTRLPGPEKAARHDDADAPRPLAHEDRLGATAHVQPVNPAPRLAWTTPVPALVAVALGGVVMAVAAALSPDAPSRLLVGVAAVGLLGMAALGFRQRPRLALVPGDDPHLVVRTLTGPTSYTREQILRVRAVSFRRLGRKMPMLEIDVTAHGAERLLIFGRWDLGAHPEEVYHTLRTELNLRGEDVR